MTSSRHFRIAVLAALPVLLMASGALAQQGSGGFLDNLFNRGEPQARQQQQQPQAAPVAPVAQAGSDTGGGVESRLDRIENALRQLTGTVEQLQHQNQVLQTQLKRMQDDTEYRFQHMGAAGAPPPPPSSAAAMPPANPGPAPTGDRRGDAFNPAMHPNAPGVPHSLAAEAGPPGNPPMVNQAPIGAPGGREPGAPLDLNSLAGTGVPPANGAAPSMPPNGQLPPPPPRNTSATGAPLATQPPSARPQDEYDLAYGYVLHKDYALAAQAFRNFVRKYPNEKRVAEAQYWLGESLFQQQHYHDAAELFLAVSTKYERSAKAPEALLRLGQSLAAMHKKEAACATLAEVSRKYPRASSGIKRAVAQEQKRTHC